MFVPGLVTGSVIDAIGKLNVVLAGLLILSGCLLTGLSGFGTALSIEQYMICLALLGLGWNLCYIGGTRLLLESHNEAETAKVQAINEFGIQCANTMTAFAAGPILTKYGWEAVCWAGVPCVGLTTVVALSWKLYRYRESTQSEASSHLKAHEEEDRGYRQVHDLVP